MPGQEDNRLQVGAHIHHHIPNNSIPLGPTTECLHSQSSSSKPMELSRKFGCNTCNLFVVQFIISNTGRSNVPFFENSIPSFFHLTQQVPISLLIRACKQPTVPCSTLLALLLDLFSFFFPRVNKSAQSHVACGVDAVPRHPSKCLRSALWVFLAEIVIFEYLFF